MSYKNHIWAINIKASVVLKSCVDKRHLVYYAVATCVTINIIDESMNIYLVLTLPLI